MTSIVAKWQSLSKKEMTGDDKNKTKAGESAEQTENKNKEPGNNFYSACIYYEKSSKTKGKSKQFSLLCFILNSCWNSWGHPAQGSDSSGHLSVPESSTTSGQSVQIWLQQALKR